MSDTESTIATAPINVNPSTNDDTGGRGTEEQTPESGKETGTKPPPSTKDWASVTAAEKRARAIESRAKEESKKLQAERQAFNQERQEKSAGLEALKDAYKTGNYDLVEKEFPDLYKKLTQAKLRAGNPKITEETLLAKLEAKQAEKAKEQAKVQAEQTQKTVFAQHESNFVYTMESNKDKYPLLIIESEENPELIRSELRKIASGKEAMTYEKAAERIETWLTSRVERRQKILNKTKTETIDSPNKDKDTPQGQHRFSDGPKTLSQRMTQDSSLSTNPFDGPPVGDEKSPTIQIRKRQAAEKAMMARALADYQESIRKSPRNTD